jgi:hypothetical protein
LNLNSQKLSNLPSKEKVVTSDDLIRKISEEVVIDKSLEDYDRAELEKLENRLKNLKSSNVPIVNIVNDKDKNNLGQVKSNLTLVPPKIDPLDEVMKKMLNDAEKEQKAKKKDEVKICYQRTLKIFNFI